MCPCKSLLKASAGGIGPQVLHHRRVHWGQWFVFTAPAGRVNCEMCLHFWRDCILFRFLADRLLFISRDKLNIASDRNYLCLGLWCSWVDSVASASTIISSPFINYQLLPTRDRTCVVATCTRYKVNNPARFLQVENVCIKTSHQTASPFRTECIYGRRCVGCGSHVHSSTVD